MRVPRLRPQAVRNKTILFSGGLNEEAARMQLKPGELQFCSNYFEIAGPYSGYSSISGYERFDGITSASSVALDTPVAWEDDVYYEQFLKTAVVEQYASIVHYNGYVYECIQTHTSNTGMGMTPSGDTSDNYLWDYLGVYGTLENIDVNREHIRASVSEVDETNGTGYVLGLGYFNDTVLAFRENSVSGNVEMWLSSDTGWTQTGIAGTNAWTITGGSFRDVKYKFADYNNGDEVLIIVDGKNYPRSWDGSTLSVINHANLPDPATEGAPFLAGVYNNRLFLAYEKGFLFFSAVDDPTNFDNIINTAGYIYLGDEITNIIEAPGNVLVIFCKNKVTILKGNDYDDELNAWIPQVEEFGKSNGAFKGTAKRFMGDIYYTDEEGITTMQSTDVYGDFNNAILSNKVQKTFLQNKEHITSSVVDRHYNQYKVFFSNGLALMFTFKKEGLKGATLAQYDKPIYNARCTEDSNGDCHRYFTSTDGYVYAMDLGTSFDGEEIPTVLITSYHHYGYPRNWKYFQELTLEVEATSSVTMNVRTTFDYNESYMPKTIGEDQDVDPGGGVWGSSEWGTMIWGSGTNDREIYYLTGYGTNMAAEFRTSSKYAQPHILQNMIVDFVVQDNKL